MTFPDGYVGWLATGHAAVRTVLADPRFSARPEQLHNVFAPGSPGDAPPAEPGIFLDMDAPDHTRYRRLLTGMFTVRRMRQLSERIEEITADYLDAMEIGGDHAELVEAYAQPIPAQLICELLGIPYEDRERFQRDAMLVTGLETDGEARIAAFHAVQKTVYGLIVAKRTHPSDDLLSDLATTELTDEELVNIGAVLLGAGLDTTANMLALGTYALLQHPDQLPLLAADPDQAVEELLRYLTIIPTGARAALEDVELAGELIKAGDTVAFSLHAANRDPIRFPGPDALDLSRKASGHVTFGHGIHQCLGQQLARVTMRVAFPALFARFPKLRLTVPADEVPMRTDGTIYGVFSLPVAWDNS
jgi:cytochrome P450